MVNNWLYLINLLKRISISKKLVCHLKNKNKILKELSEEKSFQFQNSKEKINPNNLLYRYKTEGITLKHFSKYQIPLGLFINLRDGNIYPREILKDQINLKSDLDKIKKGNKKLKSKDQINAI